MALTAEVVSLEENRVRLDVEVPEDEVQKRMERAIRQLGREVRVPGFRPGKAPAEVIVQRVGRDAVVQEMLKGSLGEWYSQAVAETGVQPIDDPDLDLEDVPETGPLAFQATVQVRPTATLGDYAGLEVGKAEPEVPEGALEQQLDALRERAARLQPVERAAQEGDFVVIDFDGTIGGKKHRNAQATRLPRGDRRRPARPGVRPAAARDERGRERRVPGHLQRHGRARRAARPDGGLHGHRQAGAGEGPARAGRRAGDRRQRVRHHRRAEGRHPAPPGRERPAAGRRAVPADGHRRRRREVHPSTSPP